MVRLAAVDAEHFLREELSGGPILAVELHQRAEATGISPRALARARLVAGVISERGPDRNTPWSVRLPAEGTPDAEAILEKNRGYWTWVVPNCPRCGKRHTHGGGPTGGDPRRLLGPRAAHCLNNRGEYILVEKPITVQAPAEAKATAARWEPSRVRVMVETDDGVTYREADGYDADGCEFAVHQDGRGTWTWAITHIPTGRVVRRNIQYRRVAREMAERMELADG